MNSTINIQESAASIKNILFHVEAHTNVNQPGDVSIYGYNQTTSAWDLIGFGSVPKASLDGIAEVNLTADFNHYIDVDGNMTWRFTLNKKTASLYVDYVKVDVTHTSISDVVTDKLTYMNGDTITTNWTSEDGFGSGESYINVEYWDVTAGTQFDLTNHATSEISSTSRALTSIEVGHKINAYVYTASSATDNNSTAITHGDPWPYSIPNAVSPDSWGSYNDTDHNNPDNIFSGDEHYVYMHGTGFTASHNYRVAYYEADTDGESANTSDKIETDDVDSDGAGNLSSDCFFTTHMATADPGTWQTIVCERTVTPPSTYNSSWEYMIADDTFEVEQSAIPEFPAVIAAIAVCMLCAISYIFMRRKAIYGKQER